jgi:segregation and condensation protein B
MNRRRHTRGSSDAPLARRIGNGLGDRMAPPRPAIENFVYRGAAVPKNSAFSPAVIRRSRLEAVLLVAREPLSLRKLAHLANLTDGTEVRTLLAELRRQYDRRGGSFQVEQVAGGFQLLTRPKLAPWLRSLAAEGDSIRLSPPALETLAVVAYRQPVLRSEVEAIRGVACGEILRLLLDRDLLRIVGRSEELGRPLWYGTTKRFLQAFGLSHLDELPWAARLRRKAVGDGPGNGGPNAAAESSDAGLTGGVDAA